VIVAQPVNEARIDAAKSDWDFIRLS